MEDNKKVIDVDYKDVNDAKEKTEDMEAKATATQNEESAGKRSSRHPWRDSVLADYLEKRLSTLRATVKRSALSNILRGEQSLIREMERCSKQRWKTIAT
jgi:hypothetical protein